MDFPNVFYHRTLFPPVHFQGLLFCRSRKIILLRRHRVIILWIRRDATKGILEWLSVSRSFYSYKPLSKLQISQLKTWHRARLMACWLQKLIGKRWQNFSLFIKALTPSVLYPGNNFLFYRIFSHAWKRNCQQNLYTPTPEQGSANYNL